MRIPIPQDHYAELDDPFYDRILYIFVLANRSQELHAPIHQNYAEIDAPLRDRILYIFVLVYRSQELRASIQGRV